ncbi:MAG: hypothetical protein WC342_09980 [Methanoregula sp.]|jgi:uncharacterized membrane protein HdeD (DUF308 family)
MDAKLSCLLKGLIGVIFGGLCLVTPGPVLSFFLGIFWILLITAIIFCILIAITSHTEESFFWFLVSALLLIVGIISTIYPGAISLVFALAVAVLAFYAGYSGISLALTRPKSKYIHIAGVIVSSIILLYVFLTYIPSASNYLILTVVGMFALVFGLFDVIMGLNMKENVAAPIPPHVLILKTCGLPAKMPGEESVPSAGHDSCTTGQDKEVPK